MEKEYKELPNAKDAEATVLGLALLNNKHFSLLVEHLKVMDFKSQFHRDVFQAMLNLWQKNEPLDAVLIQNELRGMGKDKTYGGLSVLANLTYGLPDMAEDRILNYIRIIKGKSKARDLIQLAERIELAAMTESEEIESVIDAAQSELINLSSDTESKGLRHVQDAVDRVIAITQAASEDESGITGLRTGFDYFDKLTSGLQKKDLIVVAARPSMGKTAWATQVATYAAIEWGKRVAFFSLEMGDESVVRRIICSEAYVDGHCMRAGALNTEDWTRISEAVSKISSSNLYIDETAGISVAQMRAKAKTLEAREGPLDLIVVDYIQLMAGNGENRQQEVSQISRDLKQVAKEFGCPLIALSQLSRGPEGRADKRPLMSDLRESGSIEQDADVVAFLYRDEYYNPNPENLGMAELILSKQRNGPTRTIDLAFIESQTRFMNLHV